jgi:hypothetical protein
MFSEMRGEAIYFSDIVFMVQQICISSKRTSGSVDGTSSVREVIRRSLNQNTISKIKRK